MGIVRFALRFPYTFYVVAALILFLGVTAAIEMPTDIFPEIKIPVVSVVWQYAGLNTTGQWPIDKAVQYDIGNPLTATRMTQHQLPAALYAPLRVVLYENDAGRAVFEYDRPSSRFGQFGDERVAAVARELDASLERILVDAAN